VAQFHWRGLCVLRALVCQVIRAIPPRVARRLADRQSLMIPSEDIDYGDLGQGQGLVRPV